MKSMAELIGRRNLLKERIQIYEKYRDENIKIGARHGTMDAEADMREFEAQIALLDWILDK